MRERNLQTLRAAVLIAAIVAAVPAGPAHAAPTKRSGSCTDGTSHWTLSVQPATKNKLKVVFTIKGEGGMGWQVALSDNGIGVTGADVTLGKKGTSSITRVIANRTGADAIAVSATQRVVGGYTCSGRITFGG